PTCHALWQRDFEHAKQVQREHKDNRAQRKNKVGVRELKSAPRDIAPGAFERNQKQRKPNEPTEDSNCKPEPPPQNFPPALARLLNKSKDFQRNDREPAGHQIQNDAAKETEEQESEDSARRRCVSRRNSRRP